MEIADKLGISTRALREMRYWFPFVFGVRHDAVEPVRPAICRILHGRLGAYDKWCQAQGTFQPPPFPFTFTNQPSTQQ